MIFCSIYDINSEIASSFICGLSIFFVLGYFFWRDRIELIIGIFNEIMCYKSDI